MKAPSPTFQALLDSLTIEQALTWQGLTDKWVYVDDSILSPNNLVSNNFTVNAVESVFEQLIKETK